MFSSRIARDRLSVLSRVLAAVVGGYVVTSLLSIALALGLTALGMNKAEAVLATTMTAFLLYALIIMAVFHARTAARAWLGLVIAGIPLALFAGIYDGRIPWAALIMP